MFHERAQLVREILFLMGENKIHIFEPPCNFLLIILTNWLFAQTTMKKREMTPSLSSLVRIWKIRFSDVV